MKSSKTVIKKDDINKEVAEMYGVSPSYVAKIRRGDRENDDIFNTVMDILQGRSKLIEEVKKRVPLEKSEVKRKPVKFGDLK